jgi:NADP-dependent 3-hydroxy acid dehydrogenase YdfG
MSAAQPNEAQPILPGSPPRVALVTGASSGIGQAIAVALADAGLALHVVGRDGPRLAATTSSVQSRVAVTAWQIDLTRDDDVASMVESLERQRVGLDVLVHAAAIHAQASLLGADVRELDLQYAINVRAPYLLTQRLLPMLARARGDIVFVNSSAGLSVIRAEIGQYAATKHALRAIADAVRAEANPLGVRVLSLYLGRTATPMQEAVFRQEGRAYDGGKLLQPADVAAMVMSALALPRTAEVTDIMIRPAMRA